MQKIALVTGSSRGIGREISLALARDGIKTYATVRNMEHAGELQKTAESDSLPIQVLHMDVTDPQMVQKVIDEILLQDSRIDILVNNAGYAMFGCIEEVEVKEYMEQFETNFFSIVRLVKCVIPHMRKQQSGMIINISSIAGRIGFPASSAYASSKFALEGLSECMRYELGKFGIKTILIEPGVIKTDFIDSMKIAKSRSDSPYKQINQTMLDGAKLMAEMGTSPQSVADVVLKKIQQVDTEPRYTVGNDAAMFAEAKKTKSDLEFENYLKKEIFNEF